jgi:hypothetical protein
MSLLCSVLNGRSSSKTLLCLLKLAKVKVHQAQVVECSTNHGMFRAVSTNPFLEKKFMCKNSANLVSLLYSEWWERQKEF